MTHPTVALYSSEGNDMLIGDVPLSRLAARVGSTPFFAYDRNKLTIRYSELIERIPSDIFIKYAVKADPMPALVQHMSTIVDGLDVASGGELKIALDTGETDPTWISFAGPGKSDTELRQAVAAGVTIELESRGEAQRVITIGQELGMLPRVAIRVNPDFSVKGSGMRMGGGPQQFGVDSEDVPDMVRWLTGGGVDFLGFHIFAGSQNLNADILIEAQTKIFELALRLADESDVMLRYLNVGGGFGIPYLEKDKPLDLTEIGNNLEKNMMVLRRRHPKCITVMEMGRYLVGEAGVYVTRVVDKKVSRGKTFLVVDGGMHHQLAASGNLGSAIRRNYPLVIGNRFKEEPTETMSVVGNLCTPLDILGSDNSLPSAEVGDLVVLFQAGAYGLTASPTQFLGHAAPVEVLV